MREQARDPSASETAERQPLVSVVIPAYNAATFLPQAIRSVLAQTYANYETIVVDDGSTDSSAHVARDFGRAVRLVSGVHKGVSAARNLGVKAAVGELIAFLDADDLWSPSKLSAQVAALESEPLAVASFTAAVGVDLESGRELHLPAIRTPDMVAGLVLGGPIIGPGGSTAVIRLATFLRARGFDDLLANGEDWDLWLRLAQIGPFTFIDEPLATIRTHGANASKNVWRAERDNLRVLNKFYAIAGAREKYRGLKRRAYGNHYLRCAGSYLDVDDVAASLRCVALATMYRPQHIGRALLAPVRRIRARFRDGRPRIRRSR